MSDNSEKLVIPTKKPIMHREFAEWFIKNTSLTFQQIADFLHISLEEIECMANSHNLIGTDPVIQSITTREEIQRCEDDSGAQLKMIYDENDTKERKRRTYIPRNLRQHRNGCIMFMLMRYPTIDTKYLIKTFRTTKGTIQNIQKLIADPSLNDRKIAPQHPVDVNLMTQDEMKHLESKYTIIQER